MRMIPQTENREEFAPGWRTPKILELAERRDKLKTELHWAAAAEGEEKAVYLALSNSRQGRFGYDWYMFDLVNKQSVKVFDRMEWDEGLTVHSPAFGVSSTVIYFLGGDYESDLPYGSKNSYYPYYESDLPYGSENSDDPYVLYFDTKYPQDGWKVGPQLPPLSTDGVESATSMDGKHYVCFRRDTTVNVLDTADREAGWKCLPKRPPGLSIAAHPDPSRDRILFLGYGERSVAYSLLEKKWVRIDMNFKDERHNLMAASIVVGDVLYCISDASSSSSDNTFRAYDLVSCQRLTVVHHNLFDYRRYGSLQKYKARLLDLGRGKLCLVKFSRSDDINKNVSFLKLKVEKETGEDKVHVSVVSVQHFTMQDGDSFEGALAL